MGHLFSKASSGSVFLVLALGACVTATPPPDLDRITYDSQPPPFCGRCDTRKITVVADDSVWIEDGYWAGDYSDWRVKRRTVQGASGTYARFRAALAPYRPETERSPTFGGEGCTNYMTDSGGAIITWGGGATPIRRVLDHGCLDDRVMNDAIEAAIAQVPAAR